MPRQCYHAAHAEPRTLADRVAATYEEHSAILSALQKGRNDEAQRLLRAHIEQSRIEVRKITLETMYQARERSLTR